MPRALEPTPLAPGKPASAHSLPPTRAARSARSRGFFLAGRRRSRLGHWLANAACAVVLALSIAASAHFALPAFESAAFNANLGPELLASAERPPSFLVAHAADGLRAVRHR